MPGQLHALRAPFLFRIPIQYRLAAKLLARHFPSSAFLLILNWELD
jgi:hypothetical protein